MRLVEADESSGHRTLLLLLLYYIPYVWYLYTRGRRRILSGYVYWRPGNSWLIPMYIARKSKH